MSELLTPCPNEVSSFYGISVSETDGTPALIGINKLNFDSDDFTVTGSGDEATIAFTGSASGGGGFYGITVGVTGTIPKFVGINTINFDAERFYVTQNFPNIDEVIVSTIGPKRVTLEDGSAARPSLNFINAESTGVAIIGGELVLVVNGLGHLLVNDLETTVTNLRSVGAITADNIITANNGISVTTSSHINLGIGSQVYGRVENSETSPPFSFNTETGSGVYYDSAYDGVGISVEGVKELIVKREAVLSRAGFYSLAYGEPIYDLVAGSGITLTELDNPHRFQIDATGGSSSGFYGIIVEESDGTNTQQDDTIRFLNSDFDISNVNNKPQINLASNIARLSDIGPGFYGINVGHDERIFKGINTLKFDSSHFYVDSNPDSDVVDIHLDNVILRDGSVAMTGALSFLTNNLGVRGPSMTAIAPFPGGICTNPAYSFTGDATIGFGISGSQVTAGRKTFLIAMGGRSRVALFQDKLVVDAGFYSVEHGEPAWRRVIKITNPAEEWQISHNLGSPDINYNLWSEKGKELIPTNAFSNDPNIAYFYFNSPQTGRAVIAGGR